MSERAVLITRPAGQGKQLQAALEAVGFSVRQYPSLKIEAVESVEPISLVPFDAIIFVSHNAIQHGAGRLPKELSSTIKLFTPGSGTAASLVARLNREAIFPTPLAGTDALLALPELSDVMGQRILIINGINGRETLAEVLRERGADVTQSCVYRSLPATDPEPLAAWLRHEKLALAVFSSQLALRATLTVLQSDSSVFERFLDLPLVVSSEAVLQQAKELGWRGQSLVARSATDADLVAAVIQFTE